MSKSSYRISPEVAGGLGPQTDLDTTQHPPLVRRLHYEFAGWSGDDIAESFPCILVTQRLADAIAASDLSGAELDDLVVTKDPQFEMLFPEQAAALPEWKWLRPVGRPGRDDFWQDNGANLYVSQRAHHLLMQFRMSACQMTVE